MPRRHFVHIQLMAWVAFALSAGRSGRSCGDSGPASRWRAIREQISHESSPRKGYDP